MPSVTLPRGCDVSAGSKALTSSTVPSAKLLVAQGVPLATAVASMHEIELEAFEQFINDYIEAARTHAQAHPEAGALCEQALLGASALIETRRAREDQKDRHAIEQEFGRIRAEATQGLMMVRPPLAVQQVAIAHELAGPIAEAVSFVADFVPYLGEVKLATEAATGRSLLGLGSPLSRDERALNAVVALVPVASKILKLGAKAAASSIALIAAKTGRTPAEILHYLQTSRAIGREGKTLREAIQRNVR